MNNSVNLPLCEHTFGDFRSISIKAKITPPNSGEAVCCCFIGFYGSLSIVGVSILPYAEYPLLSIVVFSLCDCIKIAVIVCGDYDAFDGASV